MDGDKGDHTQKNTLLTDQR